MKQLILFIVLATTTLPCYAVIKCTSQASIQAVKDEARSAMVRTKRLALEQTLINNDPSRFGGCTDAMETISDMFGLLKVDTLIAWPVIESMIKKILDEAVNQICTELLIEAQETYADIAGVLPGGTYVIDLPPDLGGLR